MMTDREMLELAAKAAGYEINKRHQKRRDELGHGDAGLWLLDGSTCWNPLTDDGDALRLAVTCGVHLTSSNRDAWASTVGTTAIVQFFDDPYAATRRAITMAAAEIGKAMHKEVNSDLPKDNYYKDMADAFYGQGE